MNRIPKIAPSLFAADFYDLSKAVKLFEDSGVDMIHYDIMDNHFVPNLSFGTKLTEDIIRRTQIPANIHLMVALDQNNVLQKFLELPSELVTIHLEATDNHLHGYLKEIKDSGKAAGISLRPKTPLETIKPYLDEIDLVLLMSVEPGFSGQKFIPESLERIKRLKELTGGRNIEIQIDGGVERNNYKNILEAGADFLIIGTAFYNDPDCAQWVKDIHNFR